MKRFLHTFLFLLAVLSAQSAVVKVHVVAPTYAGQRVLLYRYMDLFTLRTELLGHAKLDDRGHADLEAMVNGTTKGQIRIGEVNADLWMRGGSYTLEIPAPDPKAPRSVNGTTYVNAVFKDLDQLDVNALLADLNGRLDAYIAEDLATDRAAGMQALEIESRKGERTKNESLRRPGTLFITPSWSTARVDTFEKKLRGYYVDVKDTWFWQDLDYGMAGLRFGPKTNDRELFERYLKGRPVLYDVPEYVRFIGSFFEDHLLRDPFIHHELPLRRAIENAQPDSVMRILAINDFLKDPQLCELVMLTELYAQYHGKLFDREGIQGILEDRSAASVYPEHRAIAVNMLWDLRTMRPGGTLPSLVLRTPQGEAVSLDTLLTGATCLAVSASWCTYCEQEMVALETLYKEYGPYLRFVCISLDRSMGELEAYARAHPQRDWLWLYGGDDPAVMDALRLRSIPSFFLLNGNTLAQAPAPPPSNGMAALLHRLKAEADERDKLRPDDGQRAPKRR
jgi:thiol-disulfide isomerase/thioredoxin